MRIVEYHPGAKTGPLLATKALALLSALFSMVVLALMIANHFSLKRSDPIHSPALLRLVEELKANPNDEALKKEIRELDYLARRAFFTSQHFNQVGIFLLLGGVAVSLIAFRSWQTTQPWFPYPNPKPHKENLAENARWARQAVTAAGLVLVGLALSLALPWKSPLNEIAPGKRTIPAAAKTTPIQPGTVVAAPTTGIDRLKNWAGFLGPLSGHAQNAHLPIAWDGETGKGILWKTEVPKPGFSSPIIWNDMIFLSGADQTGAEIYCFDGQTGALSWTHQVRDVPGSPAQWPKVSQDTGYAASTMCADGERVFAIFANGDIVAVTMGGQRAWSRNLGLPNNPYGHASSLALFNGIVLAQLDQKEGGSLLALDARTGETRWKVARDCGASWASPLLIELDGKMELILSAPPAVVAYDPATGKELWRVECLKRGEVAPTPVYANGLLYVAADHVALVAIDVSKRAIVWEEKESMPGVCTPVVSGDWLFYGLNDANIICREAKTGQELWMQETDAGFYASPLQAGDRIYLMDRTGVMHIFSASAKYNPIAQPKLGEEAVSTPAVLGNSLVYRGTKHLFRIGSR